MPSLLIDGPGYWLTRHGFTTADVHEAEAALGVELRRGGELSRAVLRALKEEREIFPDWILDCFGKGKYDPGSSYSG